MLCRNVKKDYWDKVFHVLTKLAKEPKKCAWLALLHCEREDMKILCKCMKMKSDSLFVISLATKKAKWNNFIYEHSPTYKLFLDASTRVLTFPINFINAA